MKSIKPLLTLLIVMSFLFGYPDRRVPSIQAQEAAPPEVPQRIFQDELIAPHPSLGQSVAAQLDAQQGPVNPKDVALTFVNTTTMGELASIEDLGWKVVSSEPLDASLHVVRLGQVKGEIPVFSAGLTLQVEGDEVRSISGTYLTSIAADSKPSLSVEEAYKIAQEAVRLAAQREVQAATPEEDAESITAAIEAQWNKPTLTQSELVFFNPDLFALTPGPTALAYHLVLTTADESNSAIVIIDAETGKPWITYSNHQEGLNRAIYDGNNTTSGSSPCYRESGAVGTPSSDCVAAFVNTGDTYNYFFNTHGRDSFDNRGAQMVAIVRYGTMANAFWNGSYTAYGPGWAKRDIIAHEWTHGVTQYTANLAYLNQSGAINEAMSDIFAAMVDRDDWLIGEDANGGPIRSMANPTLYNQPDRVSNYVCTTQDNGGVHINSGIPNKLAYLMSDGGTFNGRTITAIGRNATERIFYRTLVGGLNQQASFNDLYNALLSAAAALYGTGSSQYNTTMLAAQAVELNQAIPCGGTVTADTFEVDNSSSQAKTILTDGTSHGPHNFHQNGDQDWLRFSAIAGTTYQIETFNLGTAADTMLTLYSSNATTVIAMNDDIASGNLASRITWQSTSSGTFYIRVNNFGNQGGANRTYSVRIIANTPQTPADAYETDNTRSTAKPITVGGASQTHNFHIRGDEDWVSFSASAGNTYVIETFNLGSTSDTVLELYNNAGTRLAYNDDSSGSFASRISWVTPSSGTYYARVFHYRNEAGVNTTYSLRVINTGVVGDAYEADNSQGSARPISVGATPQSHTFHIPGDQDWVYFDASANMAYDIRTLNLAASNDTVLELYSNLGTLISTNDDYSEFASRISINIYSAQRFYIKVRHYSPTAGNPSLIYDLQISVVPIVAPDSYESDNTTSQALVVVPGTSEAPVVQSRNFHASDDTDWVRFTAIAGNRYTFETALLDTRADTVLDLFVANATVPLVSNDDGAGSLASRIVWTAPDNGQYFLRVRPFSASNTGSNSGYTLRLFAYGTPANPDSYESDNSAGTARTIGNGAAGQRHNFHSQGDQDWVVFTATRGVSYILATSQLATRADTVLELFDNSGTTLLAFNDDTDGYASRIVWVAPSDGTYRARVRQFNASIFGANTDYTLTLMGSSDAYEPDNAITQARSISVNSATNQIHNFHVAGDYDWVGFTTQPDTTYTIETLNLGACSDTVLDLYNSSGTFLANNDDYNGLASRVVWNSSSSTTLYARVRHYSSTSSGSCSSYELRVTSISSTTIDTFEPDNAITTARSIQINTSAQNHNFHIPGDQDWGYFYPTSGWIYMIATTNLGTCGDTTLQLMDRYGNSLVYNDDYGSLASRIVWTATSSDPLFVRVAHYSSSTSGNCTSYDLSVTGTAGIPIDAYEPDDMSSQARTIMIGSGAQTHNFHTTSDVDWVYFDAVAGTTYTLYTSNLGNNADTYLWLYSSSGTLLASNDDYLTWASQIVWTAPATGRYYAAVNAFNSTGGTLTSTYDLSVVVGTMMGVDEPAAQIVTKPVQFATDSDLPVASDDQLRLTEIEVNGTVAVGSEFTTIIHATGQADEYKLLIGAKSNYLELVEIQPLNPDGQPISFSSNPDGLSWVAQGNGSYDLAVYTAWSSSESHPLVALRWRVLAQPEGKSFEMPVSLLGHASDNTLWQGGMISLQAGVDSTLKIESFTPTQLLLTGINTFNIRTAGLGGELPKVYLVDVTTSEMQSVGSVSYAPGSDTDLIATIDTSIKAGIYKVRIQTAGGLSAVSDGTIEIVEPYNVYLPLVVR
ncbi:M4 family metallopeptidase [Candidatus Oscillochloris fontis]|uniref:M4 family metallopeptidase n=1 Tax=Candidatus Oscillochloris fontis TaxID=2496868 RepID=UPI00101B75AC|nr:M4 family metallopeptidase [Candidatus Oscillochloris fontis]